MPARSTKRRLSRDATTQKKKKSTEQKTTLWVKRLKKEDLLVQPLRPVVSGPPATHTDFVRQNQIPIDFTFGDTAPQADHFKILYAKQILIILANALRCIRCGEIVSSPFNMVLLRCRDQMCVDCAHYIQVRRLIENSEEHSTSPNTVCCQCLTDFAPKCYARIPSHVISLMRLWDSLDDGFKEWLVNSGNGSHDDHHDDSGAARCVAMNRALFRICQCGQKQCDALTALAQFRKAGYRVRYIDRGKEMLSTLVYTVHSAFLDCLMCHCCRGKALDKQGVYGNRLMMRFDDAEVAITTRRLCDKCFTTLGLPRSVAISYPISVDVGSIGTLLKDWNAAIKQCFSQAPITTAVAKLYFCKDNSLWPTDKDEKDDQRLVVDDEDENHEGFGCCFSSSVAAAVAFSNA